jgi:WD40 repeat protein
MGHRDIVFSLFLVNENELISGSGNKTIKLWNLEARKCEQSFSGHKHSIRTVLIYKNTMISGSDDKTVKFWN